ncbi:MAG: hypothetical protein PHV34_21100 [Verrucomicrobiae bacterium]|nr:hypothetical protein [Verrucomicrobiae bacterium]
MTAKNAKEILIFTLNPLKLTLLAMVICGMRADGALQTGSFRLSFDGINPSIVRKNAGVQYSFDLSKEEFFIHVPKNHSPSTPFGVLIFIHSGDSMELPEGWDRILASRKLIFMAPQKAGNSQAGGRRLGLPLIGVLKLMEKYAIDRERVFAAGLSGGGRTAIRMAFLHPEWISGVVSCCGADYIAPIQWKRGPPKDNYGLFPVDPISAVMARCRTRFALITGPGDFRHNPILDLYEDGFVKNRFMAGLFDIPGMGHSLCSTETLEQALEFIEKKPAWMENKNAVAERILKTLTNAGEPETIESAAMEAWRSAVDPELQRYAAAFARSVAKTTGQIKRFEFMLAALDDPRAASSHCEGTCNALTRQISRERMELLTQNPNLDKK